VVYAVLFWRKLIVFRYFPPYRSCIAFTRPELLVIARPAPGFEGTGFVAGVAVVAPVAPDCK
jgi:hypothetical protein